MSCLNADQLLLLFIVYTLRWTKHVQRDFWCCIIGNVNIGILIGGNIYS